MVFVMPNWMYILRVISDRFSGLRVKINFSTNATEMDTENLFFRFHYQNFTFKTTVPSGR